jgi:hypothetical protein
MDGVSTLVIAVIHYIASYLFRLYIIIYKMDTPTMAGPVDDGESWKLGDIIKDNNGKEWKLVKLGSGVTRSHKDADGNLLYDDIGGDMIVLQFAEPSKKVKKGRKWEVIEGAREQVIHYEKSK